MNVDPTVDPGAVKIVYHECTGGSENCSAGLAPKVGPLGFSPKLVAHNIAEQTGAEWHGLPITVKITAHCGNFRLEIIPSAKSLIIKNLQQNAAVGQQNGHAAEAATTGAYYDDDEELRHSGNITMDQTINIAREMRPRSTHRKFEGVVIDVLKACHSLGCKVEGQYPEDIMDQIYNKEIDLPLE